MKACEEFFSPKNQKYIKSFKEMEGIYESQEENKATKKRNSRKKMQIAREIDRVEKDVV